MELQTDGEGFLLNRADWTPEVAGHIANTDGVQITEDHMKYIVQARRMFDEDGVVPPLRAFIKAMGVDKKVIYADFMGGPMKLICKWGGLPKPTGCV